MLTSDKYEWCPEGRNSVHRDFDHRVLSYLAMPAASVRLCYLIFFRVHHLINFGHANLKEASLR